MSQHYKVLSELKLDPQTNKPTGKTDHFVRGKEVHNFISMLKIVQYPSDTGCYLLYFDSDGNELTDTYHPNFRSAVEQAHFEFAIPPQNWKEISEV